MELAKKAELKLRLHLSETLFEIGHLEAKRCDLLVREGEIFLPGAGVGRETGDIF